MEHETEVGTMTVGSFKARFNTPCRSCGQYISPGDLAWFEKGQPGYWCEECEDKQRREPQAQDAPRQSSTVPWSSIESDAVKGHRENMESAKLTRDVLANLTVAIVTLRDAIEKVKR